jgi:glutamate--cysteine ligase
VSHPDDSHRAIGTVDDLVGWFDPGAGPHDRRVGTEQEKIGLWQSTLQPVAYGNDGVRALLERLEGAGWNAVREGDHPIALEKGPRQITIEPGAQLELSGAPLKSVHDFRAELEQHLDELIDVSRPPGITWLGIGFHPVARLDEVPWVPKRRYEVMRPYLATRGARAHEMMKLTATVQANFDYGSEDEAARMMRAAMGVTSIVTALCANSPIRFGRDEGQASARAAAWLETDPDRCGLLPFVFEPDFGFRRYAEWALDVPMFFVRRDGRYLPAGGASFRRFLAEGLRGERATLADWELHLSTLFPEVRLKRYLEVRGADSGPAWLTLAIPALWKGMLYDADALHAADALTGGLDAAERERLRREVPGAGLRATAGRHSVLDLGRELLAIAREGLRRQNVRDAEGRAESLYLEPLEALVASGRCPADLVRDAWRAGGLAGLVASVRYHAGASVYSGAP